MTFLAIFKLLGRYYWILLLIIIALLFYSRQSQKRLADDYKDINDLQSLELVKWQDKAGKNRARADIAEIEAKNAKQVINEDLRKLIQKEVGNIKKNLISYSSIKATTEGEISGALRDTLVIMNTPQPIKAKAYNIKNKYLEFEAVITPDSLIADYKVYHNFDLTYYYKRPGKPPFNIFKKKKAVAEIKFDNPGSQGDSIYTIVLERRRSWLQRVLNP